ncbi:unnamed protein product [Mytilus edulis]|uniref:DZIP3-like HEPN domain-containing protein n=1 Tax=Mytilus edulis TaxID=6550 RepID=A0A8S3SK60_MYTED|nr:unnamed protein product [Mytilus edulis]
MLNQFKCIYTKRNEPEPESPIRIQRSEEREGSTRFSPEDALSLFTQSLDLTLRKHKEELFKEIDTRIGAKEAESVPPVKQTPKFRYDGNEKQFSFNGERLTELEKTLKLIEKDSPALAIQYLEKSIKALKERNKLLRIADKYGWDVVDEYIDDPITEGTDDATKLRQADYRAKAKRRNKVRTRPAPYIPEPESPQVPQDEPFRKTSSASTREVSRNYKYPAAQGSQTRTGPRTGIYNQNEYSTSSAPTDSHDQDFEFECSSASSFRVDNLRRNLDFWRNTLNANNFVLNVVEFGYLIPFYKLPPSAFLKNNSSAIKHTPFVESSIIDLLSTGVIREVKDHIPFIVNPLSVSVNDSDVPDSKTFDVTLMILLLRNLTSMTPPLCGFDCLPSAMETTHAAYLARIKHYKNYLAHLDDDKIDSGFFNTAWNDITCAIDRLGGQQMKQECDHLKTKPLDQTNQEIMMNIKHSYKEIRELKESFESLKMSHTKMIKSHEMLQQENTKVKKSHETLQDDQRKVTAEMEKVKTSQKDTVPWNVRGK